MTPQTLSSKREIISLAQLARHTGHKADVRMWIGIHGSVYDITDFLPLHPGGSFIAAASGGVDASQTFDDLAHTNNPEVSSLLTKYFIGYLAPKPILKAPEIANLYDMWSQYLRVAVELLTTLGLEVQDLSENSSLWVSSGMIDAGGIRKFYQFQSRLMKSGLSILFGVSISRLFLKGVPKLTIYRPNYKKCTSMSLISSSVIVHRRYNCQMFLGLLHVLSNLLLLRA